MRSFIPYALILAAVKADEDQFIPKGGKTLEEVFGPMAEVDRVIPWWERRHDRAILPPGYFDMRKPDNCTFPFEVYIIQDETASFQDNYEQMKKVELKRMHDFMKKAHPGSTFGVGTHRDIPIWSLGEPETDYCWQFRLPLTSNYTELRDVYDELISTGGGDAPEYQFGAMIAAAQEKTPGWSNPAAARLLVVSTDAGPHFEGDGFNKPDYNLNSYAGRFDRDDPEGQCKTQYAPLPEDVKKALKNREAYTAFLIFDGEYNQGGKPIDAWNWFNCYIDQSAAFVSNVQEGAKDFWEQLSKAIEEIEAIECPDDSTTTTHEPATTKTHAVATPEPTPEPTTTVKTTPVPTVVTTPEPEPTTTVKTTPESTVVTTPEPEPTTTVKTTPEAEPTTTVKTTPEPTVVTTPEPEPTTTMKTTPEPTAKTTPEPTVVTTTPEPTEPTTTVKTTPEPEPTTTTPEPTVVTTTEPEPTTTMKTTPEPTVVTTTPEPTPEPTTEFIHTTEEPKEPECPPCPGKDDCPCPAVKIVLQEKPLYMKLEVNNTIDLS